MAGNKNSGSLTAVERCRRESNLRMCDTLFSSYLIDKKIKVEDKVKIFMPLLVKCVPAKVEAEIKAEGITVILPDGKKVSA